MLGDEMRALEMYELLRARRVSYEELDEARSRFLGVLGTLRGGPPQVVRSPDPEPAR